MRTRPDGVVVLLTAGAGLAVGAATTQEAASGALARWVVPGVDLLVALAGALTVGVLLLTATALPVRQSQAYPPARRLVVVAAASWSAVGVLASWLHYRRDHVTGAWLGYLGHTDAGREALAVILIAGIIAVGGTVSGGLGTVGVLAVLGCAGAIPAALAGTPAAIVHRGTAVTALGVHVLGVGLWFGGLLGSALLRRGLGDDAAAVVRRYVTLADWGLASVAGSGVLLAAVRLPRVSDLATGYGALLGVKAAALVVLAVVGRRLHHVVAGHAEAGHPESDEAQSDDAWWRLVGVELALLAGAFGLGTAVTAATAPSAGLLRARSATEVLTGYPLPPPLTPAGWLTQWQPDPLWLLLSALAAWGYLAGVRRLRRRGESWSTMTTISWLGGLVGVVYFTSGPPAVYGRVLFSLHMLAHMSLSMVVPVFLVLGAPVTLALQTLPARTDGSRGAREWLVAATQSRVARVLSFPPTAAFLFAGSLVFFYYSPLFEVALSTHVGLELMYAHFLFAGYLFTWVLIGRDPGPRRVTHPLRLITLLVAMTFHAFFGVALLSGRGILAAHYFDVLARPWWPDLLPDQRLGGGIAWGIGDLPAILLSVILAVQWSRDDDREARRLDTQADRDGDAQLAAYNAMLAALDDADRVHADRVHADPGPKG